MLARVNFTKNLNFLMFNFDIIKINLWKATAGESHATFIYCTASEFVELYVGMVNYNFYYLLYWLLKILQEIKLLF